MKSMQRDTIIAPPIKNNSNSKSGERGGIWAKHSPRDSKTCPRAGSHSKPQRISLRLQLLTYPLSRVEATRKGSGLNRATGQAKTWTVAAPTKLRVSLSKPMSWVLCHTPVGSWLGSSKVSFLGCPLREVWELIFSRPNFLGPLEGDEPLKQEWAFFSTNGLSLQASVLLCLCKKVKDTRNTKPSKLLKKCTGCILAKWTLVPSFTFL